MDVLGSQPPARKGHLRQCSYDALEALTSLGVQIGLTLQSLVADQDYITHMKGISLPFLSDVRGDRHLDKYDLSNSVTSGNRSF